MRLWGRGGIAEWRHKVFRAQFSQDAKNTCPFSLFLITYLHSSAKFSPTACAKKTKQRSESTNSRRSGPFFCMKPQIFFSLAKSQSGTKKYPGFACLMSGPTAEALKFFTAHIFGSKRKGIIMPARHYRRALLRRLQLAGVSRKYFFSLHFLPLFIKRGQGFRSWSRVLACVVPI